MRYRLRTLLIVLALGPPLLSGAWGFLEDYNASLAGLVVVVWLMAVTRYALFPPQMPAPRCDPPKFRFTIRDVLWLTTVVALVLAGVLWIARHPPASVFRDTKPRMPSLPSWSDELPPAVVASVDAEIKIGRTEEGRLLAEYKQCTDPELRADGAKRFEDIKRFYEAAFTEGYVTDVAPWYRKQLEGKSLADLAADERAGVPIDYPPSWHGPRTPAVRP